MSCKFFLHIFSRASLDTFPKDHINCQGLQMKEPAIDLPLKVGGQLMWLMSERCCIISNLESQNVGLVWTSSTFQTNQVLGYFDTQVIRQGYQKASNHFNSRLQLKTVQPVVLPAQSRCECFFLWCPTQTHPVLSWNFVQKKSACHILSLTILVFFSNLWWHNVRNTIHFTPCLA